VVLVLEIINLLNRSEYGVILEVSETDRALVGVISFDRFLRFNQ
jgi:hypothetical protein